MRCSRVDSKAGHSRGALDFESTVRGLKDGMVVVVVVVVVVVPRGATEQRRLCFGMSPRPSRTHSSSHILPFLLLNALRPLYAVPHSLATNSFTFQRIVLH